MGRGEGPDVIYEARWFDLAGVSGVGPVDELHAIYLKGAQAKQANPEWRTNPNVHVWATAMWPSQPDPMGRLWIPGMQLGYALADPPPDKKQLRSPTQVIADNVAAELDRRVRGEPSVPTLGQHQDRVIAIEAGIIDA